jgi:hypothetical protein
VDDSACDLRTYNLPAHCWGWIPFEKVNQSEVVGLSKAHLWHLHADAEQADGRRVYNFSKSSGRLENLIVAVRWRAG